MAYADPGADHYEEVYQLGASGDGVVGVHPLILDRLVAADALAKRGDLVRSAARDVDASDVRRNLVCFPEFNRAAKVDIGPDYHPMIGRRFPSSTFSCPLLRPLILDQGLLAS